MSPACQSCPGTTDSPRGLPNGRDYWLCESCHDAWWDWWERWSARDPRQADRVRARATQRRIAREHGIADDGSRMTIDGGERDTCTLCDGDLIRERERAAGVCADCMGGDA